MHMLSIDRFRSRSITRWRNYTNAIQLQYNPIKQYYSTSQYQYQQLYESQLKSTSINPTTDDLLPMYTGSPRSVTVYSITGLVDYYRAWNWQQQYTANRIQQSQSQSASQSITDIILLLEHKPVYTIGRRYNYNDTDLLQLSNSPIINLTDRNNTSKSINYSINQSDSIPSIYRVDRGGSVTYHGPGQLILYPLLDLTQYKQDLHWYTAILTKIVSQSLIQLGLNGNELIELPQYTGVWINSNNASNNNNNRIKLCSIGLHCTRWYTLHGLGLNINSNLNYFNAINPCGIKQNSNNNQSESQSASTIQYNVGNLIDYIKSPQTELNFNTVSTALISEFERGFNINCNIIYTDPDTMDQIILNNNVIDR